MVCHIVGSGAQPAFPGAFHVLPMLLSDIGEVSSEQEDGAPPTILAAGSAPGESGVSVVSMRFARGAHFIGTLRQHMISFVSEGRINCRLAGTKLLHEAHEGSLAICPAGFECAADTEHDLHSLLIAIRPRQLALAAAEETALEARLVGCLSGHDQKLLDLARALATESRTGYPHGALGWNETAGRFIDALVTGYISVREANTGGILDLAMLARIRDFVNAHLDEPIDVATLATMTGRSQFHFSRAFTRSVGVSPYRYVVHLRLRRAVELVRERRLPLAEIAVSTGFADQSHLTRWVRRVYGVSLTQLAA